MTDSTWEIDQHYELVGGTAAGHFSIAGVISSMVSGILTVLQQQGFQTDNVETMVSGDATTEIARIVAYNERTRDLLLDKKINLQRGDHSSALKGRSPEFVERLLSDWADQLKSGLRQQPT